MSMKSYGWMAMAILVAMFAACDDDDPVAPGTGEIEVTIATTGDGTDDDGYVVRLDEDEATEDVDVDDELTFEDVEAGSHTVELTDVASNCTVDGDNPRNVTVESGEAAPVEFAVTCAEP
jgi:hypothetical protein